MSCTWLWPIYARMRTRAHTHMLCANYTHTILHTLPAIHLGLSQTQQILPQQDQAPASPSHTTTPVKAVHACIGTGRLCSHSLCSHGLCSEGLCSYGLDIYGLSSYGLCGYGLYVVMAYRDGICSYGLHTYMTRTCAQM